MARRGFQPAPTQLKVLRGTRRDRVNRNEPVVPPDEPSLPPEASAAVQVLWEEKLRQLKAMGLAHRVDQELLYAYCVACVKFRRDVQLLDASDVLIQGKEGRPIRNPILPALRDHAHLMLVLGREFGFTPSARSQIRMEERGGPAGDRQSLLS